MSARAIIALVALVSALSACAIVRTINGNTVTGTCAGACDHYTTCKPGATAVDRTRCLQECPQVFADRDSIGAYESLACDDAVAYVDGDPTTTASPAAPSSRR